MRPRVSLPAPLLAEDLQAWDEVLRAAGVRILREPARHEDIGVECFFFEDPGGYALEIQRFLRPKQAEVFHCGGHGEGARKPSLR